MRFVVLIFFVVVGFIRLVVLAVVVLTRVVVLIVALVTVVVLEISVLIELVLDLIDDVVGTIVVEGALDVVAGLIELVVRTVDDGTTGWVEDVVGLMEVAGEEGRTDTTKISFCAPILLSARQFMS